jgi:hypothetical protein
MVASSAGLAVPSSSRSSLRKSGPERLKHFGQSDPVRWYGRDFSTRLAAAGFEVTAHTATPEECAQHGLQPGEKVFVGVKLG